MRNILALLISSAIASCSLASDLNELTEGQGAALDKEPAKRSTQSDSGLSVDDTDGGGRAGGSSVGGSELDSGADSKGSSGGAAEREGGVHAGGVAGSDTGGSDVGGATGGEGGAGEGGATDTGGASGGEGGSGTGGASGGEGGSGTGGASGGEGGSGTGGASGGEGGSGTGEGGAGGEGGANAGGEGGMPATCAAAFGAILDFELCGETATTCRFYARLNDRSCASVCQEQSWTCQATESNGSENCDGKGANSCGATDNTDAICTCER